MSYTVNSGSAILTIDPEKFPTIRELIDTVTDAFVNQYDEDEMAKTHHPLDYLNEYDSDDFYCEIEKYISFTDGANTLLVSYNTEENNHDDAVSKLIIESLCGFMTEDYVTVNWVCDDSRDGISSGQCYLDRNGVYHDSIAPSKTELLSVREQIQQDILSYASAIDDEGIFFTQEVLDNLCQIVVDNFDKV